MWTVDGHGDGQQPHLISGHPFAAVLHALYVYWRILRCWRSIFFTSLYNRSAHSAGPSRGGGPCRVPGGPWGVPGPNRGSLGVAGRVPGRPQRLLGEGPGAPKIQKVLLGCHGGSCGLTWGDFGRWVWAWTPTWEVDMLIFHLVQRCFSDVFCCCCLFFVICTLLVRIVNSTAIFRSDCDRSTC